ncbi:MULTISPECIES: DUF6247 family protein [unclassified Embleya]|uniref:DUF6247 family protein n=1 Tax=unclassified Embleya TaxID=2699296 RepID=UPI0033DE83ED
MDEQTTDPRRPRHTIGFGGTHHATPAEIRAELPADLRDEFEKEYGQALDTARDSGDLQPLADMLGPWQSEVRMRRSPDWPETEETIRRINAGLPVDTVPADRTQWGDHP